MSNHILPKPTVLGSAQNSQIDGNSLQLKTTDFLPRLACHINLYGDRLILSQGEREFDFGSQKISGLSTLLSLMDGNHSLQELQQLCSPDNPTAITTLINTLDQQGLIDNAATPPIRSGHGVLLELEALTQRLLDQRLGEQGETDRPLWQLLQLSTPEIPDNVLHGFALEYYHLFSHLSCFQSATLGFQASTTIRHRLNQLYGQTHGYEQLMVAALAVLNVTPGALDRSLPLPETMALYNGLTFWASFEPLFFLSILGSLFKGILESFSQYLAAIEQRQLDAHFVEPVRQLLDRSSKSEPIARSVFQEIPHIDHTTEQRLKGQIHLYVDMGASFHRAIGHYYGSTPHLLRPIAVS